MMRLTSPRQEHYGVPTLPNVAVSDKAAFAVPVAGMNGGVVPVKAVYFRKVRRMLVVVGTTFDVVPFVLVVHSTGPRVPAAMLTGYRAGADGYPPLRWFGRWVVG